MFRGRLINNLRNVSPQAPAAIILQIIKKVMQTAQLRNHIMRAVVNYEDRRNLAPQGRRRKLSLAYILDRIFYVCKTGCQWSQLDVKGSSYKTIYHYFNLWSKAHIFESVFYAIVNAHTLQEGPLVVDTSFVKNVHGRDVTGRGRKSKIFYPTDRGRKATKISLLTDSRGTPLCCVFHRGNKSDTLTLRHLLDTASRKTERLNNYSALMGDKGYDSSTCRSVCARHHLQPMIPKRGTKDVYRGRYVIEQTFGILDQFRRLRVRYDALIRNFKSFHFLALG
jgi:putative transposase